MIDFNMNMQYVNEHTTGIFDNAKPGGDASGRLFARVITKLVNDTTIGLVTVDVLDNSILEFPTGYIISPLTIYNIGEKIISRLLHIEDNKYQITEAGVLTGATTTVRVANVPGWVMSTEDVNDIWQYTNKYLTYTLDFALRKERINRFGRELEKDMALVNTAYNYARFSIAMNSNSLIYKYDRGSTMRGNLANWVLSTDQVTITNNTAASYWYNYYVTSHQHMITAYGDFLEAVRSLNQTSYAINGAQSTANALAPIFARGNYVPNLCCTVNPIGVMNIYDDIIIDTSDVKGFAFATMEVLTGNIFVEV